MSTLTAPLPRTSLTTTQQAILALEPLQKRLRLKHVLLQSGKCTIGSAPDCTLSLAADGIRTHHCLIVSGKSRSVLKAWDTRTWLNDGPVDEAVLKAGDRLVIGPVEFRVREASKAEILSARKDRGSQITSAGTNGKNNLEHAVHAAIQVGILPSSAVPFLSPGATDQSDHLEDSNSEGCVTTSEPNNVSSKLTPGPSASPGPMPECGERTSDELKGLHAKLQEQTDRLNDDIALQHTKLRQLHQRQKAERVEAISRDHDKLLTEQRAKTARRKEVLLRDLLDVVRSECEEIIAGKRNMRRDQRRQRETLARLQNEFAIDAAQLREARRQDENTRRDFQLKSAKQLEATQRAEVDLEDEITRVHAAAESLRSERHSLTELRRHVEEERALLKVEQKRIEQSKLEAEARLRRDREAIADQQREMDDRLKDLPNQVTDLATRETEIEQQQAQLRTQQQLLEAEQAEFDAERSQLDAERSQLDAERERLQGEQAQLQAEQVQLHASTEHIQHERVKLDAQAVDFEKLDTLQAELASERATIEDERRELDAERESLASQQDDWKRKHEELLLQETKLSTDREELSLARQEFESEGSRQQEERNSLERDREVLSNQQGEIAAEQACLAEDRTALEKKCEALTLRTQEQSERRSKSAEVSTEEPQVDPARLQHPNPEEAGFDEIGQPLDGQLLQSAEEETGVRSTTWPFLAEEEPDVARVADADEEVPHVASPSDDQMATDRSRQDSGWLLDQNSIDSATSSATPHDGSEEGGLSKNPADIPSFRGRDVENTDPATGESQQRNAEGLWDSQDSQQVSQMEMETPGESAISWLPTAPPELDAGLTEDDSSLQPETDIAELGLLDTGVTSLDPTELLETNDVDTAGDSDLIGTEPVHNTTAEAVQDADEDESPLSDLRSDLSALFALPTSDSEQGESDHTFPSASQETDEQSASDEQSSLTAVFASLADEDTSGDVQSFDASESELPTSTDVSLDQSGEANGPAIGQPSKDDYKLDDADDPDSVSAYMDKLLTRSQGRVEAAACAMHRPESAADKARQNSRREPTPRPRQTESVFERPADDAVEAPADSLEAAKTEDAPCQTQVDKEAVRAHILSLREVANLSARTAIAKHSSKMKLSFLMMKGLLLVASATLAALLLTSETWGTISYVPLGRAAMAICAVVGIELVRSTLFAHRAKRARKDAEASHEDANPSWPQEPGAHDES
jgi:hypothetical protein